MAPLESNNTEKNASETVAKCVVSSDVKEEKKILCLQLVLIPNVYDSERPGFASCVLFSLAHLPIDVKHNVT